LKRDTSQANIAAAIGTAQSSVSREIKRNSGKRGYRYKQAQTKAAKRRSKASSGEIKFTYEMIQYIEYLLTKKQWSPEQISGWMKNNYQDASISHEWIYQYIWHNKRTGGSLYKHLRCHGKKYNKRSNKTSGRGLIPNRVGIEERPDVVNAKERVGDFEVDTIMSVKRTGAILSIVDRKSKVTILSLLPNKTAEEVGLALVSELKPFQDDLHTITSDQW